MVNVAVVVAMPAPALLAELTAEAEVKPVCWLATVVTEIAELLLFTTTAVSDTGLLATTLNTGRAGVVTVALSSPDAALPNVSVVTAPL